MTLSTETARWLESLKTEGNLTDEAYNSIKNSLNDKADNFVKGSVLRQDDYSRQMSAVKETQDAATKAAADLKAKEDAVTKYQAELGTWRAGADVNFKKALAERELAERKATATAERLRTVAESYGLDATELLKDLDVTVTNNNQNNDQNKNNQFDASGFVKREDLGRAVAESGLVDASIHDIAAEYQELTGQPFRGARQFVEEAIKSGKPLTQYAAEKFGFDKLRADKATADLAKREAEIRADERTKVMSENMLPGGMRAGAGVRDDLKGSPIFSNGVLKAPGEPGNGPSGGVSAAIAAFQSGKFKGGHTN